ncbi:MAG: hypothetical protein IT528_05135 [Nitrosomonas sp.]|nr:hypothetical protein [Nitrosomonas sp.]
MSGMMTMADGGRYGIYLIAAHRKGASFQRIQSPWKRWFIFYAYVPSYPGGMVNVS